VADLGGGVEPPEGHVVAHFFLCFSEWVEQAGRSFRWVLVEMGCSVTDGGKQKRCFKGEYVDSENRKADRSRGLIYAVHLYDRRKGQRASYFPLSRGHYCVAVIDSAHNRCGEQLYARPKVDVTHRGSQYTADQDLPSYATSCSVL
jgi:hypothetical protein